MGHYQTKNNSGNSQADKLHNATDKSGPDSLRPPPKVPLIEPKAEPEEQEGELVSTFCSQFDVNFANRIFFCAVFAVQVKVEEVEMETPINPPDNSSHGSLVRVKQEEGVDRTKMEKCEAPRKGSLDNTGEKK